MLLNTMTPEELIEEMKRDQPAVNKIERRVKKEIEKALRLSSKNERCIFVSSKAPSGNAWSVIGYILNTRYATIRICKLFNGKNFSYLIFKPGDEAYILISSHAIKRFRERSGLDGMESASPEEVVANMFVSSEFVTFMKANIDKYLLGQSIDDFKEFVENDTNFIAFSYRGVYICEITQNSIIVKTYMNPKLFENDYLNKYGYAASAIFYINNNRHLFNAETVKICTDAIKSMAKGIEDSVPTMGMPSPFIKASGRDFRKDMKKQARKMGLEIKSEE